MAVVCVAATGYAADKATKCVVVKLTAASKYAACRLKTDAKAAKSGGAADYAKCDAKFLKAFDQAETKAGSGVCPSEGNVTSVDSCLERVTSDCTPLVAGCDGAGDCNACSQCAQAEGGPCATETNDCLADTDCVAFIDCINLCADDQLRIDQCVSNHPGGYTLYLTALSCIFCDACPIDCDAVGSGCQ